MDKFYSKISDEIKLNCIKMLRKYIEFEYLANPNLNCLDWESEDFEASKTKIHVY